MATSPTFEYLAFLSYSRTNAREAYALRSKLHRFRIPVSLIDPVNLPPHNTKYVRSIAIDKEVFQPDDNFYRQIERVIDASRFLIVLCSKEAAKSAVIEYEVDYFLKTRGAKASRFIIPVILNGSPDASAPEDECLPRPLRKDPWLKYCQDNDIPDPKPIGLWNLPNLAASPGESIRHTWDCAVVLTTSYLLRVNRDKLYDEFQQLQRQVARRRALVASFLAMIFLALSVWALVNWNRAYRLRLSEQTQRRVAMQTLAESDFQESARLLEQEHDTPGALIRMTGALTDNLCPCAANRLYNLMLQRSWLVPCPSEENDTTYLNTHVNARNTCDFRFFELTKLEKTNDRDAEQWRAMESRSELNNDAIHNLTDNTDPITLELSCISKPNVCFAPNANYYYALYEREHSDYYLDVYNAQTRELVASRNFATQAPQELRFSPDGTYLVVELYANRLGQQNSVCVLSPLSLQTLLEIPIQTTIDVVIAFSSDSRRMAILQARSRLSVFDLEQAQRAAEPCVMESFDFYKVAFSQDNRAVIVGNNETSKRYVLQKSTLVSHASASDRALHAVALVPSASILLCLCVNQDNNLEICSYDLQTRRFGARRPLLASLQSQRLPCNATSKQQILALPQSQRMIVKVKLDQKTYAALYRTSSATLDRCDAWELERLIPWDENCSLASASPQESILFFYKPKLQIYDLNAKSFNVSIEYNGACTDVAISADENLLAITGSIGTQIWRKSHGEWERLNIGQDFDLYRALAQPGVFVRFSSRNKLAVTNSKSTILLDPSTGDMKILPVAKSIALASAPAFSEDSNLFAYCPSANAVQVIDVDSGLPVTAPLTHLYDVRQLRLCNQQGRATLATSSGQGSVNAQDAARSVCQINVWDVQTQRRVCDALPVHEYEIFFETHNNLVCSTTSNAVIAMPILGAPQPDSDEEIQTLTRVMSAFCQKYGGGALNQWRAPQYVAEPGAELDAVFASLTPQELSSPALNTWRQLDLWLNAPIQKRTVLPESKESLQEFLRHNKDTRNPLEFNNLRLMCDPNDPEAYSAWALLRFEKIALDEFLAQRGVVKSFNEEQLSLANQFVSQLLTAPYDLYQELPSAVYFAQYHANELQRRFPDNQTVSKACHKLREYAVSMSNDVDEEELSRLIDEL